MLIFFCWLKRLNFCIVAQKIEVILEKLPPAASWRGSGISCQVVSWSVIINHRLTLSPTWHPTGRRGRGAKSELCIKAAWKPTKNCRPGQQSVGRQAVSYPTHPPPFSKKLSDIATSPSFECMLSKLGSCRWNVLSCQALALMHFSQVTGNAQPLPRL